MTIEITRGDTKRYTLRFNVDISGYRIFFVIKDKHEDTTYLHKVEASIVDGRNAVAVLPSSLTSGLGYRSYPFGVVMTSSDGGIVHTLMKGLIKVTWRVL